MRPSIIVAGYGPNATTIAAVRRARALAGSRGVTVVAALLPGAGAAAGCAGIPGTRVMPGVGSEALRQAMVAAGPGPVLFIHDDVLLTGPNLERMMAELSRKGGFVVPWSNDVGMDHFCGPLPESRHAAGRLRERAASLGTAPVPRVVRPSCLLAAQEDMALLADSHLVDPRLQLDLIDLPVTIARAVVAHDSTCTASLLAPGGPDGRPLLVASMIVRDEEQMLPGLLASIEGLVDGTVICDTGSTDRTVEVARSMGATVMHREWRDDFSWARNESLIEAEATGAWWLLTIDADDRVLCSDPVALRQMLATYLGEYEAFGVAVENRDAVDAAPSSAFTSTRIHRATGRYRFIRPIHESLVDVETMEQPKPPLMAHLMVVHLGYHSDVMDERGKVDRNLRLTRTMFEADPTPKNSLEYARSIKLAGGDRHESSRLMAGILATFEEKQYSVENNRGFLAFVLTSLADDALALGDPAAALFRARQVMEMVPADDLAAKAFVEAALQLGRPQEVLDMQERRRRTSSATPTFRSEEARAAVGSFEAAALARLGRLDEAFAAAVEALSLSPRGFATWPDMVDATAKLPPDAGQRMLLDLALRDPTGQFFAAVLGKLAPATTARFCLAYCTEGGQHAEGVRVGLMAALLSGLPAVFRDLVPYAGRLDSDILGRIAQRAQAKGHPDLGELLLAPTVHA
jgi:tetratricopeptide (TPR) repeat protein